MNCQNCGAPVREGDQFCKRCGTRIAEQPTVEFVTPDLEQYGGTEQVGGAAPMPVPSYEQVPQKLDDQTGSQGARRAEKDAQRQANNQMKEAKAAYKEARKAAGKSAAPKVIGIIVAILVVAGAGAAAMWYFGGRFMPTSSGASSQATQASQASQESSSVQASRSSASDNAASSAASSESRSTASSSASASSAASEASIVAKSYLGTWSGDMASTDIAFSNYNCYGARKHPMELEIVEFEPSGRVSANAKVLVHAHDAADRDVDSHEGDVVAELTKLTGTFDNGSISFKGDTSKGVEVNISLKTDDSSGSTRQLVASVTTNNVTDVYNLTKEA